MARQDLGLALRNGDLELMVSALLAWIPDADLGIDAARVSSPELGVALRELRRLAQHVLGTSDEEVVSAYLVGLASGLRWTPSPSASRIH